MLNSFGAMLSLTPDIVTKIALTHSLFNIVNTFVFLPFLRPFANLVTRLVPDKEHRETPHLTFLDVRLLESPAMGVAQSHDEIVRMSEFTAGGRSDLLALHDLVDEYLRLVSESVSTRRPEVLSKAHIQGEAINVFVKESRRRHLAQVGKESENPRATLIFTDMLNAFRRVKDHALNIAEALAGEK